METGSLCPASDGRSVEVDVSVTVTVDSEREVCRHDLEILSDATRRVAPHRIHTWSTSRFKEFIAVRVGEVTRL